MPVKGDRNLGSSSTLDAMRSLRASGPKSFEALVARLLTGLSGIGLRLCQSGSQGGVDAIADVPFAVEAKRHKKDVSTRELLGGLTNATLRYRGLELWVVAATCTIGAQAAKDLDSAGEQQGIAVRLFDEAPLPELPDVSRLVALGATDMDTTINALADPSWRSGRKKSSDLDAIHAELTAVRDHANFGEWMTQLRTSLRDLPTWRRFVQVHNRKLRERILKDAKANFLTAYRPAEAIRRTAESDLSAWLHGCTSDNGCPVAAVVGNRYDGKTWLVYRWLTEHLEKLTVPVFFFSSDDVKAEGGHVDEMIVRHVRSALRLFARHTEAMIERQKKAAQDSARPWCVIVLDGANEYVADPTSLRRAILEAIPVGSDDAKAALLVTCRRADFDEKLWWRDNRPPVRVDIGAFDEKEFAEALTCHSLSMHDVAEFSAEAQKLMRHPRYFDVVIRHRKELPRFETITPEVLDLLDASEKGQGSPEELQNGVSNLATEWSAQRLDRLQAMPLNEATQDVDHAVNAVFSRGILSTEEGQLVLNAAEFHFGMGLVIRKQLLSCDLSEFVKALDDVLEPHRSDDEKVRWLGAAVATSVVAGDDATRPEVVEFLLSQWLSSRNFSHRDVENLQRLAPLVIDPMLRLLSSGKPLHNNVRLLAEPMIRAEIERNEAKLVDAVRRWFRIIPAGAHWFIGDEGAAAAGVESAPSKSSLIDLELTVADRRAGQSVRELQRLGLSLGWEHPHIVRPVDALALFTTRDVVGGYVDDAEQLAVQRILATSDMSWFEAEVASSSGQPETTRARVLHNLIATLERRDLTALLPKLPQPMVYEFQRRLTPAGLTTLRASGNAKQVFMEAEHASQLALDPKRLPPRKSWRTELARVSVDRLAGSPRLHSGRMQSREDLDLDDIEPALAAWAPDAGVRIWRALFDDIPRRIEADDPAWSWVIDGHLALLTGSQRRRILNAIFKAMPKVEKMNHALEHGFASVLAETPASQRLLLFLDHPFSREWHTVYKPMAFSRDSTLKRGVEAAVRKERDPLRLKRARYLLSWLGGMKLTAKDLERLIPDALSDDGAEGEDAATMLIRRSRLAPSTPPSALVPLLEIAHALPEIARQYDAYLLSQRRGFAILNAMGVVRALSAPKTARANGASADVPDQTAVFQGLQYLADRITRCLADPASDLGRSEQFPKNVADEVTQEVFDAWVRSILSSGTYAYFLHSGLLLPVVRHALKIAHRASGDLWKVSYPFPRGQVMGTRWIKHRVDSRLCVLHDPELDEAATGALLRDLIRDARSGSELIQIALAARVKSQTRLRTTLKELLRSPDELDRARARFLAGWLPENKHFRARLAAADPSRWVERIGKQAIHRLDRERWAREWLRRFLSERNRVRRWAAGRLFVACSDAATPFWAEGMIWNATRSAGTVRAEAGLLLETIEKKPEDSVLRNSFLGYRVRDLEQVIPPWRRAIRWEDVDVTASQDE